MTGGETRKADPAGIVVAALLALTAAVVAFDASRLELGQTYGLGPKAMPYVVAAGLTLLAIGNLIMGLRGDLPARESSDPKAIVQILGGLAALIASSASAAASSWRPPSCSPPRRRRSAAAHSSPTWRSDSCSRS